MLRHIRGVSLLYAVIKTSEFSLRIYIVAHRFSCARHATRIYLYRITEYPRVVSTTFSVCNNPAIMLMRQVSRYATLLCVTLIKPSPGDTIMRFLNGNLACGNFASQVSRYILLRSELCRSREARVTQLFFPSESLKGGSACSVR